MAILLRVATRSQRQTAVPPRQTAGIDESRIVSGPNGNTIEQGRTTARPMPHLNTANLKKAKDWQPTQLRLDVCKCDD